jgi:quercetin dioxygenase-like cupin family protein
MDPLNVDEVETVSLTSSTSDDAAWVGGYFAYGGHDADASTVITFAVPPGKRLGKHVDTREETQFILAGSGELLRDGGATPIRAGDLFVLKVGESHDLRNTGEGDLRVVAFFAGPDVEQHWDTERWPPGEQAVTSSP